MQGISLVRRNNEWHHFDPLGTAGVFTNGSASVVSNNLYDVFGVLRYQQGSAETPVLRCVLRKGEDEISWLATRGLLTHRLLFISRHLRPLSGGSVPSVGEQDDRLKYCKGLYETCMDMARSQHKSCVELCTVSFLTCASLCFFAGPLAPECHLGCLTAYGACRMGCAILKYEKERGREQIFWYCMRGKPGLVPIPPSAPPALQ
ncbi:MAG: hypothetical protein KatS3mg023_2520 [Armatimonadota bacterium]|nr:MAG: hypothetical protein KatS3mg023_2520 [Armatimonadota bacterium]